MSGWLEDTTSKYAKKKAPSSLLQPLSSGNTLEDLTNEVFKFVNQVHKVNNYSNQIGTARETELLRKNLGKERDVAKVKAKELLDKIKKVDKSDLFDDPSDKEQFNKMKKQFMEAFEHFMTISKESLEKERKHSRRQSAQKGSFKSMLIEDAQDSETAPGSPSPGEQMQTQARPKKEQLVLLSDADASTIATEQAIAKQTLTDLRSLEQDMVDLKTCYVDLKNLIDEQQEGIDMIQTNVQDANANVETAVLEIKDATKSLKKSGIIGFVALGVVGMVTLLAVILVLYFFFKPF